MNLTIGIYLQIKAHKFHLKVIVISFVWMVRFFSLFDPMEILLKFDFRFPEQSEWKQNAQYKPISTISNFFISTGVASHSAYKFCWVKSVKRRSVFNFQK